MDLMDLIDLLIQVGNWVVISQIKSHKSIMTKIGTLQGVGTTQCELKTKKQKTEA